MNFESTHEGAAVNAKGMTNPEVTLGAEGQSLESPVLGNGHAGFGRGSGETQCGCAPCSYLTGLFRGFGDDGMPLAHVLDPHEPYSGQQEGT